ncbi:MAG: DNA-processing protein DprA [Candidatus Omnitrophica bacterium]|jgi:DNA processing protein|nr:DNA-processing protein DprA [Candidatus Omnitrophota bacterium]
MTKLEVLVSLNMIGEIGSVRLGRLLDYFDRLEDIFTASPGQLMRIAGVSQKIADRIHAFKKEDLDKELEAAEKLGLEIITLDDADYPENLKNIPSPPIVLYVKGNLEEEDKSAIGVVGSRRASFYGLSQAEKFSFDLAKDGVTIVSGMARGVDTSAHQGALKAHGRTIAVIGSGFNHIYPAENKELAEKIAQNGAVISEFPLAAQPLRGNFPRRNRVISGLSLGTLVIEAAQNSGALITADFALEQGRDVFCLPGKIDSSLSLGPNKLIQQGAKLVCSKEDILEELKLPLLRNMPRKEIKNRLKIPAPDPQDAGLYDLISDQPVVLDDILEKTNLNISRACEILLTLQVKKLIKELPGKQFIKNNQ